jgi:N6-adenosine-specific RNA methylase IME4
MKALYIAFPDQAYGELTANLHVASYTLERALQRLEALLAGDAWMKCGSGYSDVNAFMDSIRLDHFKPLAEDRQRIVRRIKELQPAVSNRAIARTLGVGHDTIDRDLGRGANAPPASCNSDDAKGAAGANAPSRLTGKEAAKRVIRFEEAPLKRAERRAEILKNIVDANPSLPIGSRYAVIYADPAWRWEVRSRETGLDHAPEAHYDTMTVDEIMALDVASIAADDCVLFLWVTSPLLLRAGRDVMESAWGFTYKTSIFWDKVRAGTGYWVRGRHELLLIGTKGAIPAPLPGTQGDSVIPDLVELIEQGDSMAIAVQATEHSRKPIEAVELIERWYPAPVPKIELFCRGRSRPGWAAFGNEVERKGGGR